MSNVTAARLEDIADILPQDPVALQHLAQLLLYRADAAVAQRLVLLLEDLTDCLGLIEDTATEIKQLDGCTSSYAGSVAGKLLTIHRDLGTLIADAKDRAT